MVFNPRIQPETLTPIFCTKINTIRGRLSKWFWGYKMLKPNSYATFNGFFLPIWRRAIVILFQMQTRNCDCVSFKCKDLNLQLLAGRHWVGVRVAPIAPETLWDARTVIWWHHSGISHHPFLGRKVWHLVGTGGACQWHQKWHRTAP